MNLHQNFNNEFFFNWVPIFKDPHIHTIIPKLARFHPRFHSHLKNHILAWLFLCDSWIMNLVIVNVISKCMHSSMSKKSLWMKFQIQPWVTHALCYLNSIYFYFLIILCIILVEILSKNYESIKFEYNS